MRLPEAISQMLEECMSPTDRRATTAAHVAIAFLRGLTEERPRAPQEGLPLKGLLPPIEKAPSLAVVNRMAMLAVIDLYASEISPVDSWRRTTLAALRRRLENLPVIMVDVTMEKP